MTSSHGFEFLEQTDEMLDILDGYRAKLVARGYSEENSEAMVVAMHNYIFRPTAP